MTTLEITTLVSVVLAVVGGLYVGLRRIQNGKTERNAERVLRHEEDLVTQSLCFERHKVIEIELRFIRETLNKIEGNLKELTDKDRTVEIASQVAQHLSGKFKLVPK